VLVSSNRSDFAAPNATVFHPDIVSDATAAALRYASSLEAAVADLYAALDGPHPTGQGGDVNRVPDLRL
jgi:hypothetical protein